MAAPGWTPVTGKWLRILVRSGPALVAVGSVVATPDAQAWVWPAQLIGVFVGIWILFRFRR